MVGRGLPSPSQPIIASPEGSSPEKNGLLSPPGPGSLHNLVK